MKFNLCLIGIHKFSIREIHIESKLEGKSVLTGEILMCEKCGKKALGGRTMETFFIIPTKYKTNEVDHEPTKNN